MSEPATCAQCGRADGPLVLVERHWPRRFRPFAGRHLCLLEALEIQAFKITPGELRLAQFMLLSRKIRDAEDAAELLRARLYRVTRGG